MKGNILLSIVLCMFVLVGNCDIHAQKVNDMLSKKEMRKEFDYLIRLVECVNPHLPIYKEMMGYDVIEEMKKKKIRIKKVDNWAEYYLFVSSMLNKIPEDHTRFIITREPDEYYAELYPFLKDSTTIRVRKRLRRDLNQFAPDLYEKISNAGENYLLHLSYIEGRYYVVNSVDVRYVEDSVAHRISVGDELLKINGTTIPDFMKRNLFNCDFLRTWDVDRRIFYSWCPTRVNELISLDIHSMTVKREDLFLTLSDSIGKEYVVNYTTKNETLTPYKTFGKSLSEKKWSWLKAYDTRTESKVLYFDSILYVKMKSMGGLDFFKEEIVKYKGLPIGKVVIDVRGNGGGSDNVWQGVLRAIIDTTFCRKGTIGIADSDIYRQNKDILSVCIGDYPFDSLMVYKDPILKRKYRLLSDDSQCMEIVPDSSSLGYKGQIYLLHDRNSFSSSIAFLTFALGEDRVVAIGENNGSIGGYGVTPFVFQLPYSKFPFIMHASIHIPNNAKNVEDYFWNKTEVKVHTNLEWEVMMYGGRDIFTPEILKTKDPYFKKVLEM